MVGMIRWLYRRTTAHNCCLQTGLNATSIHTYPTCSSRFTMKPSVHSISSVVMNLLGASTVFDFLMSTSICVEGWWHSFLFFAGTIVFRWPVDAWLSSAQWMVSQLRYLLSRHNTYLGSWETTMEMYVGGDYTRPAWKHERHQVVYGLAAWFYI